MPRDITSPFTPGRPVPVEFFTGRQAEITRLRRKVADALGGRIETGFLIGERGIGKSSLASFVRRLCEKELHVLGVHTFLGGVSTVQEVVRRVFDQLVKENADGPIFDKLRDFLGNRVRRVGLFGISVEFDAREEELRRLTHGFGATLRNLASKVKPERAGLLLILDDINGIVTSDEFANWMKSLIDEISTSGRELPLFVLLVGLEERRQALISQQPSLARVFDLVDIRAWSDEETREFFLTAFSKVGTKLDADALSLLTQYAGGLPVLAHEIGDAAFTSDKDGHIDRSDALSAVITAADVVGRKHLDPLVFRSIRSAKYRKILRKLADAPFKETLTRAELRERLAHNEVRVLDNFLQKMKGLGVLVETPEEGRGTYRFSNRLHYLYFFLEAERAKESSQ